MKKLGLAVCVTLGLLACAQAAPISYGGNYYDLVAAGGLTWDQAKSTAEALSYSGQIGHLATLTSQAEHNAVKELMDRDGVWSMAYVGGRDSGSGFTWVNGEGAVNLGAWGSWAATEPTAGDYGMTLRGSAADPGYNYQFGAETQPSTNLGWMLVEYQAVPEPTGLALLAIGCAAAALRRRVGKQA